MSGSEGRHAPARRNPWRMARWLAAAGLLLVPLAMMQVSDEWHWTPGSFVGAAVVIGGSLLLYELFGVGRGAAYRAGIALAIVTSLLTVWTTIVRDDGDGMPFLLLVLAAGAGAFVAWLRPAGMARAMLGVAVMQALLGVAIATAPSTASMPGGAARALLFCGVFCALWLLSALCFRAAAKAVRAQGE